MQTIITSVRYGVALMVGVMLMSFSVPAMAEAAKDKAAPKVEKETPLTRLQEASEVMTKDLTKNKLLQFNAIETTYRTIRAVEDVQMSVTRAVTACGKANPEIKDDMDARLRDWKKALRPTMKKASSKLDKMVLLQDFSTASKVRGYLKMFDEAILYRNEGIKEVPATEKDACLKLKDSMDDTQEELVKLLTETLGLDQPLKTSSE